MMERASAPSLRRAGTTLAQDVQGQLQARIRDGRYPAGQRLPTEAALGAEFGVSRTVVREAVTRLQASGLVLTRHGIGTFVQEPPAQVPFQVTPDHLATLQDVIAVLELRIAVETESAALAAERRKAADVARLRRHLRAFEAAVARGQDAVAHDLAFHATIAQATGNRRFEELLAALGEGAIPRARLKGPVSGDAKGPAYLARVNAEHAAIVEAIAQGDPEGARQAMRQHLMNSKARRAATAGEVSAALHVHRKNPTHRRTR